ncbi:hypothetical protein BKA80DRAFT_273290 [Phyllosticta citrichinensis]
MHELATGTKSEEPGLRSGDEPFNGKPDDEKDGRGGCDEGRGQRTERDDADATMLPSLAHPAAQCHGPGTSIRTCFRHSRFKSLTSAAGWLRASFWVGRSLARSCSALAASPSRARLKAHASGVVDKQRPGLAWPEPHQA